MRCGDVSSLLPEYLDELLSPEARRRVDAHLQGCELCRVELAAQNRALIVLERVGNTPSPDLWQCFSRRLADGISCREVRDLLPAYQDAALSAARSISVHNHLRACSSCAAEAEMLETSLEALGHAAAMPVIDLWPAFQARQEAERLSRQSGWGRMRAVLRSLWEGPALQPALGLAAAGLLIFAGRHLLSGPSVRTHPPAGLRQPTQMAKRGAPPDASAGERPVKVAVVRRPETGVRKLSAAKRVSPEIRRTPRPYLAQGRELASTTPPRQVTPVLPTQPSERTEKDTLIAAAPDPGNGVWTSQLQVSYDLPTGPMTVGETLVEGSSEGSDNRSVEPSLFHGTVEVNSSRAQAEVKSEVVQVVQLLAGIEEATENPFRSETDGY